MKSNHPYDSFRQQVSPALQVKLDEIQFYGYGNVNEDEFWSFLTKKKWRKPKEEVKLFEIIEDIMAVKAGEYINYSTVEALRGSDLSLSEEELKSLFK
ncbi:post-transcriptional regulator [Cytobacillus gottheilii]|uniref:post-transcriptional regulator n=1 Tax=Cytobacillus gottheilii TaxID=859144 RepID=UPI0009BA3F54|nr:post-transcriptional regulator [Cytobacillus gottheilii]